MAKSNWSVAWRCWIFRRFDAHVDTFARFDAARFDDAYRSDARALRYLDAWSLPCSLPYFFSLMLLAPTTLLARMLARFDTWSLGQYLGTWSLRCSLGYFCLLRYRSLRWRWSPGWSLRWRWSPGCQFASIFGLLDIWLFVRFDARLNSFARSLGCSFG